MSATTPKSESKTETDKPKTKDAPYYCPGCGRRYEYRRECTGRPEAPHQPIEVVSTDEIGTDKETPAPNTGE